MTAPKVETRRSMAAEMRERRSRHKREDVINDVIANGGVGTGFWPRVEKTDGCWLYSGPRDRDGYGKFSWRYAYFAAHRFAYLACRGEIAKGLTLDHLCHDSSSCDPATCQHRRCVNPDHLVAVPHSVNQRRAVDERRRRKPARMTPNVVAAIRGERSGTNADQVRGDLGRHPRPTPIEGVTHAHLSGRAMPPADLTGRAGPQAAPHKQQRQEQR